MLEILVRIDEIPGKGRGLFAARDIPAGSLVHRDPVALVVEDEVREGTFLWSVLFDWDPAHEAVALGPMSFLNHADPPNCQVSNDEERGNPMMRLTALRDIRAGEELTIRYRCPLWFDPK